MPDVTVCVIHHQNGVAYALLLCAANGHRYRGQQCQDIWNCRYDVIVDRFMVPNSGIIRMASLSQANTERKVADHSYVS